MESNLISINYGCGETKLEGFVNIDIEESQKPDVVCDLTKDQFPYKDGTAEKVYMIHSLEHIEMKHWGKVFFEVWRVLAVGGQFVLAYPEFEKCAKYFIENHRGLKDFFRAALYGRQFWPGDYHVVPMVTDDVVRYLSQFGFHDFHYGPDLEGDWYTFLSCKRGDLPMTYEDVLRKEIFNK